MRALLIRKLVLIGAGGALALSASALVEPEAAIAVPVFPGSLSCPVGTWTGTIKFTPPLTTVVGNFSPTETFKVAARLKCLRGTVTYKGVLTGTASFTSSTGAPANDCNSIFPAAVGGNNVLTPTPTAHWKIAWTAPVGAPTKFSVPAINVSHLAVGIEMPITNAPPDGGSFPAGLPGTETLAGAWPYPPLIAACGTAAGLVSKSLAGSFGTW